MRTWPSQVGTWKKKVEEKSIKMAISVEHEGTIWPTDPLWQVI